MIVPSFPFLAFAAAVALLINVSASATWRRFVLLLANVAFVLSFTHSPRQLLPFAALLAFGFASVKFLERRKSRAAFWLLTGTLLLVFCWLKHYTFVPAGLFLPYAYFTVGMSYVLFRVLHLAIETYQGGLEEPLDVLSYANYTLNFTSLVSGPIQFYGDYRRTERLAPAALDVGIAFAALERIVLGFFKVSIVSPLLAQVQHVAVAHVGGHLSGGERVLDAAALIAVFPIFLYANFSGYMDVVIGVARFLRLELPENFNHPFVSVSFIDFWTRWHITLSTWLKTYVYSPLLITLMRTFPAQRLEPLFGVFAYFVTFFLVGVWHGQTANFLMLGVFFGLGVSANKLFQIAMVARLGRKRYVTLCAAPAYAAASRGLTFAWVGISLLWFWSDWSAIENAVRTLGIAGSGGGVLLVVVAAAFVLTALDLAGRRAAATGGEITRLVWSPYMRTAVASVLVVLTFSVTVLLRAPAPSIVYKGF
jgi:D-alanyl-lipoteichoic acid acyltransferase DltB (MBOAT superfamily)